MGKQKETSCDLKRVFVVLTREDLTSAIPQVSEGDVIISDIYCPSHLGVTIVPAIMPEIELELVSKVKEFFNDAFPGYENIRYGYVNNFYECSVRPIFQFITTIKSIITETHCNIIFHLPTKITTGGKTSTYFMAEWESMGPHLYDRHSAILPYLIDYLQQHKQRIVYGRWRAPKQVLFYNALRLGAVYIGRLYQDVRAGFQSGRVSQIEAKSFERIFIVRTLGQANTIIPYLRNSTLNSLVINIPAMLGYSNAALDTVAFRENVTVVTARQARLRFVFFAYLMSLINIFRRRKTYFVFDDITLNVTQALKEVEVMSAKLLCYQHTLLATLDNKYIGQNALVFSLEQKSPHAWVDSLVARKNYVKPVQVKQCNQLALPLPEPVFSDFYLCDTPHIKEMFHKSWPADRAKVKYIGTISMISTPGLKKDLMLGESAVTNANSLIKVCFVSGVHSSVNLETINSLDHLRRRKKIKLIVKLHPRDKFRYDSLFPEIKFVTTQHSIFSDFANQFDLAITYPSGIVMDLVSSGLPFILYTPKHEDYQRVKAEPGMEKIIQVNSIEQLSQCVSEVNTVISNHPRALEHFYNESGLVNDINEIERKLTSLAK